MSLESSARPARPSPPVVQPNASGILVNPVQRKNKVLGHLKHVPYEFSDIVPDYQLSKTTCALFLSLKYHALHPEYIHSRIEHIAGLYTLRILLLLCDTSEHQGPIKELTKICQINNITIMMAWSLEEVGIYLSTYKLFEHKSPDLIKERVDKDYPSVLRSVLTTVKGINKTDVETLRSNLGSFSNMVHATPEQLNSLPGIGSRKVERFKNAVDMPFKANQTGTKPPEPVTTASQEDKSMERTAYRSPSPEWPEWDIELDLNDEPVERTGQEDPARAAKRRKIGVDDDSE